MQNSQEELLILLFEFQIDLQNLKSALQYQMNSIAVKVIEHEFSEIGNCAEKRNASLDMCSISEYSEDKDSENILVKIGGEPSLIQDEESYYKELEKHGFSFFLSIDEDGYSEDVTIGSYPFGYGALYLYKRCTTNEIIAGFWQCS